MSEKPVGVMPLCIIAIFLGIMGVLGGALGVVGLLIPTQKSAPSKDPKMAEVNAEFEQRMAAMMRETRPVSMAIVPAVLVTSLLLAAAGFAALKSHGLGFIRLAFASNLVVDLIGAIFGFIVQWKSLGIMKWYMSHLPDGGNPDVAQGVQIGLQIGIYTSMFFGAFWIVMKAIFYVLGLVYFNKRAVVDAFSGRPAPEASV